MLGTVVPKFIFLIERLQKVFLVYRKNTKKMRFYLRNIKFYEICGIRIYSAMVHVYSFAKLAFYFKMEAAYSRFFRIKGAQLCTF